MDNIKFMDGTPVDQDYLNNISAINHAIAKAEEEFGLDELESHAAAVRSRNIEKVKAKTMTFYFGNEVIGEVKFRKTGTKLNKVERAKKILLKKIKGSNQEHMIGQKLFSQFCSFKIS